MAKSEFIISKDIKPLRDAATQTFALIGRKGGGKSYAAGKFLELFEKEGTQVVVMDTVGNWYGARVSANGKDNGLDIPIFGGLRGDTPLLPNSGELIADVITETGRSVIIDISQFNLSNRKKFATAFGERLWLNKKSEKIPTPLMLILEEAQLIVPQQAKGSEHMLGIYEEIIRLGRNYGIGVMMLTQRPQSVNKEVLNQAECLLVFQINGAHERKALADWIVHKDGNISLLKELPFLEVGQAYLWSPQWLGIFQKIRIEPKETFDSTATPKAGTKIVRREPKPLDISEITLKMEAMIERAKENDPHALRDKVFSLNQKIERLELQLKQQAIKQAPTEVHVLRDELPKLQELLVGLSSTVSALNKLPEYTVPITKQLGEIETKIDIVQKDRQEMAVQAARQTIYPPQPISYGKLSIVSDSSVNGYKLREGEKNILAILARFNKPMTDAQIFLWVGGRFNKQSYKSYISNLKGRAYITSMGNERVITPEGYEYVVRSIGAPESLPKTKEDILAFWSRKLRSGESDLLRLAFDADGEWIKIDSVSEMFAGRVNVQSLKSYLSTLKTNGLIDIENNSFRMSQNLL